MQIFYNNAGVFLLFVGGFLIGLTLRKVHDYIQEKNKLLVELEETKQRLIEKNIELHTRTLISGFLLFSLKNQLIRMERKIRNG